MSASDVPMKSQFSGEMHHPKPLTESSKTLLTLPGMPSARGSIGLRFMVPMSISLTSLSKRSPTNSPIHGAGVSLQGPDLQPKSSAL